MPTTQALLKPVAKRVANKANELKATAAKSQAGIQSVEVGFGLLQVLAQAPGAMMLRDLAQSAGMSPAKAHRYLVSYQRLGLVTQDSSNTRYDLGPAALRLGLAALQRLDPVQLARRQMDGLMQDVGHTVAMAVWGNHGPVIVHWQEPSRSITVNLRLGDVMPLLTSATGRCFSAYLPPAQTAALLKAELAQMAKLPRAGLPQNAPQVQAILDEVRANGLARVVDILLPGISGMAAPVWDAQGHMVLCLVSLGASSQFDAGWQSPIAKTLQTYAKRISLELGAISPL